MRKMMGETATKQRVFNEPLARETLARIEAHPETWDQSTYYNECGTAFCYAGHALVIAEGAHVIPGTCWCGCGAGMALVDRDGKQLMPYDDGARVLGISPYRANVLFSSYRTLDQLRLLVDYLAAHPTEDNASDLGELHALVNEASAWSW